MAAGDSQGARPGGEEGQAGVASAPGQARPSRRRAPACAQGAEAEGRHPLPGLGGGPRQDRGREWGRGAPAGGRVTRSSPFPLSLPVADAAAPAAPRAEDWTAEPRAAAAAAAERPHRCRDPPARGRGPGLHRPGPLRCASSHPSARLLPPLPAPRPRTPRTSSGDGAGGGGAGLPLLSAPPPPASGAICQTSHSAGSAVLLLLLLLLHHLLLLCLLLPPRSSLPAPPSPALLLPSARSGIAAERGAGGTRRAGAQQHPAGGRSPGGRLRAGPPRPPAGPPPLPPSLSARQRRRRRRRRQWQSPEEHHAEEEAAGAPARSRYEPLPLPPLLRLLFLSSPRVSSRRRPRSLPRSLPLSLWPRRLTPGRRAFSPLSCLVRAPASRTGAPRTPRCALPPPPCSPSRSHPLQEPRSPAAN